MAVPGRVIILVAALPWFAEAADKSKSHYHQGVLSKFKAGPPAGIGFRLSGPQQSALAKGENVLATIANKGGDGSCIAVLDIPVPKHIIWDRITDYKRPRRVPPPRLASILRPANRPG